MKRETGYYLVIDDGELAVLWYSKRLDKFYFPADPSSCRDYELDWVVATPLNLKQLKEYYNA